MKVAVIGAGSFGCSIAQVLADNKHDVFLLTKDEQEANKLQVSYENPFIKGAFLDRDIQITSDYAVLADVEIIVYVVPSFALRAVGTKIKELGYDNKINVICTKGIETGTLMTGLEILRDDLKFAGVVTVLSGPTHAEELALKKMTTIVSTSANDEVNAIIQKAFSTDYLRVYTNRDERGVEILGAAKNVLAIAAGICDSYPTLGDNAKAAILTRGLKELRTIGEYENADPETFYGLTGMGDLIVTAMSVHSRNRKFGELLGTGLTKEEALDQITMTVEGIYAIDALYQLAKKHNLDLPIINGVYALLNENVSIDELATQLINRELKNETE